MPNQTDIMKCPNCGSTAIDIYCSSCGQKIYQKRFTLKGIAEVIGSALNIERGFIHTLIWMFRNPGLVVNDYLKGKTKSYFNPLNYILIIAGVYAFLIIYLNILDTSYETTQALLKSDSVAPSPEAEVLQERWFTLVKSYSNLIPLLMIPFTSLFSKWYYKKQKLYYGEHLIINTFIFAQNILITILFAPILMIFPALLNVFPLINMTFTIIYFTYALVKIFRQSVFKSFVGSLFIYVGGFLFFMIFLVVLIFVFMITLRLLGLGMADLVK